MPKVASPNPNLPALFALVVCSALLPTATARGQFVQQGNKLVASGSSSSSGGTSVALSADGNTAIVGAPGYFGIYGYEPTPGAGAWIFTRSNGIWTQQGNPLVGTTTVGGPGTVFSVALSADGNTAIAGGAELFGYPGGVAWVFTRTNGVWTQQGGELIGKGRAGTMTSGASVALSPDGNTAVMGDPSDNGGVGTAWVFVRSGGVWTQQGGKLVATDSVGASYQGASVALSGNTLVVGGSGDNNETGAVWVYTRTGSRWTQDGSKLVGKDATNNVGAISGSSLGWSVALSADGNTLIAGGEGDSRLQGAAWIFALSNGVWIQQGVRLVGNGAFQFAGQGRSVSISGDGNTVVVGGPLDRYGTGAVWVFTRSNGIWSQRVGKIVGTDGDSSAQGSSVALSADGSTLLVGSPEDNYETGAAWAFSVPPGPAPSIGSGEIVNAASLLPGVAPGTWMTIQGSNLSATTRIWTALDFVGGKLPTQLDGVSVTVNGKPAYVYYISPTQLNVLTPDDTTTATGYVPVQVTTSQGVSNVVNTFEDGVSRGLFTFTAQGQTYAVAVRSDGTSISPASPTKPGDIVLLFGTGFGATAPPSPAGQLNNPAPLASGIAVFVGSSFAQVQSTTLISPGLYQINIVIPEFSIVDSNPHDYSLSLATGEFFGYLTIQQ